MNLNKKNLKKIKGDASFRLFFRNTTNNKNSIIVYAKRERRKNLLIYDCINKLLINNKIIAPKLYAENYRKNYIEIEDFGDDSFYKLLKRNKSNKIKLFKDIIILLDKIQKIKKRKFKNFSNNYYQIPIYSKKKLFEESALFCDWYIPKVIREDKVLFLNRKLKEQIKKLLSKIKQKNDTFVHRDFHASNLIKYKNKTAIIDSQDACIGNIAYDLASLIDDVRFKSSVKLKKLLYKYFFKLKKNDINKFSFENDFEILSILRNLKIIGIFTRLSLRDKKSIYLKLIPHAWKLIELRLSNKPLFKDLKNLLDVNFPKKIRIRK